DLGPRIAHALLPIKGKGGSDWSYSWIPVFGPVVGGVIAGLAAGPLLPILT
ncbi:Major intrinsic protein, partial [Agreia pratensis]